MGKDICKFPWEPSSTHYTYYGFSYARYQYRYNKLTPYRYTGVKEYIIDSPRQYWRTGDIIKFDDGFIKPYRSSWIDWFVPRVSRKIKERYWSRNRELPRYADNQLAIIIDVLKKILKVTDIVIEDIKAKTLKNARKWNRSFSPLEVGKKWFKDQVISRGLNIFKFQGFNTKEQRERRGFKKSSNKLSNKWEAHCVDSHCLSEMHLKEELQPTKFTYLLNFLRFNRRELHRGFKKGGIRRKYGSTRSEGLNRGTLVKHIKHGLTYIGGTSKGLLSLYNILGKRIYRSAKTSDCKILNNNKWRLVLLWN